MESTLLDEDLDWDRVRFGREEKRGVILGLELHQLMVFGILMAIGILVVIGFGFPLGAILGGGLVVLAGVIALPRVQGRSLLQWLGLWRSTKSRQLAGHGKYLRTVAEETPVVPPAHSDNEPARDAEYRSTVHPKSGRTIPGKPERFGLPGALAELLGYELPTGAAFIYDPVNQHGIIAGNVRSMNAFTLQSEDEQINRIDAFSAALTALSNQEGVEYIQLSDQTSVVSGQKIRDYYSARVAAAAPGQASGQQVPHLAGEHLNAVASKAYEDLIGAGKGIHAHEGWVVIVLSKKKLERTIKANGGGLGGFMDAAMTTMVSVGALLSATGAGVQEWMSLRQLSDVIRRATDPAAALELADRGGDAAGVAPHSAGPMAMIPHWRHLVTDTGYHRTWWISEWPRKRAKIGFLNEVLFAGDFRHTVTLIAKPYSAGKAMKEVTKGMADWEAGISIQQKLERPVARAQMLEGRDLAYREVQLTDGFGALKLGGYITVTADTEHELEIHAATLQNAAAVAQVELRVMYGQQAEAFVASTMPLGRGLL
jgi:hypothetical protein